VDCLPGGIVSICLISLNYIFCIACLKVTELTLSHSWSITSAHTIVIKGFITLIARLVGAEPNPNDIIACSERLNLVAFKQMKFSKVDSGRICWIYLGNQLMHLPNVDWTSLLNWVNLYFLPSDEELS